MSVSHGAIKTILNGIQVEGPVLQILSIKSIPNDGELEVRLKLTDGDTNHSYVQLSRHLCARVLSGDITIHSLIRLDNYVTEDSRGRLHIIVEDLTVITQKNNENLPPMPEFVSKETVMKGIKRKSTTSLSTIPINLLDPFKSKWIIKGRVLSKTRIMPWKNKEGTLFRFILYDDSCDIQVTAFTKGIDKFYDLIEVGKTYTVANAVVKDAYGQHKSTKSEYDLNLKSDSEIAEVVDDMTIPQMAYKFVDIAHIKDHSPNTVVDIIGVAHKVKDAINFFSRTQNKDMLNRDIVLVDRTGSSIILTLWSEDVSTVDNLEHPVVVVVRSAVVSDFGGGCLNVAHCSTMLINPEGINESQSLMEWYQNEGHSLCFNMYEKTTIADLKCIKDKNDNLTVEAVVIGIKKEDLVHKFCEKCNNEVEDLNNGLYSCWKCSLKTADFKSCLMINVEISDSTGPILITALREMSEKLLGKSSEEVMRMIATGEQDAINKMISGVINKGNYSFSLSVGDETINGEICQKVHLVEFYLKDDMFKQFEDLGI